MKTLAEKDALIAAVIDWVGNCEGMPSTISDAELMKAVWTYEGDRIKPDCDECDGECDEPCRPATVAQVHGSLDAWIAGRSAQIERNHRLAFSA